MTRVRRQRERGQPLGPTCPPLHRPRLASGCAVSAFSLVVDAGLALNVSLAPSANGSYALHGSLSYATANISVGSSNVGPVNAGLLQTCVWRVVVACGVPRG